MPAAPIPPAVGTWEGAGAPEVVRGALPPGMPASAGADGDMPIISFITGPIPPDGADPGTAGDEAEGTPAAG
jgi:hypothetical protein